LTVYFNSEMRLYLKACVPSKFKGISATTESLLAQGRARGKLGGVC